MVEVRCAVMADCLKVWLGFGKVVVIVRVSVMVRNNTIFMDRGVNVMCVVVVVTNSIFIVFVVGVVSVKIEMARMLVVVSGFNFVDTTTIFVVVEVV